MLNPAWIFAPAGQGARVRGGRIFGAYAAVLLPIAARGVTAIAVSFPGSRMIVAGAGRARLG